MSDTALLIVLALFVIVFWTVVLTPVVIWLVRIAG